MQLNNSYTLLLPSISAQTSYVLEVLGWQARMYQGHACLVNFTFPKLVVVVYKANKEWNFKVKEVDFSPIQYLDNVIYFKPPKDQDIVALLIKEWLFYVESYLLDNEVVSETFKRDYTAWINRIGSCVGFEIGSRACDSALKTSFKKCVSVVVDRSTFPDIYRLKPI